MTYLWVRQSLYRILSAEMSVVAAKVEAWMLATAWLTADRDTQNRVVAEIQQDLTDGEVTKAVTDVLERQGKLF